MGENEEQPIDVVILWVNGNDKAHYNKMLPYILDEKIVANKDLKTRFNQVDEIKYTIDSILKFASFVRNIFVVTDNQIPSFLCSTEAKKKYPNVSIVDHQVIFSDKISVLPIFNCRPIETRMYKIPGLSEHFIYFNDDMFLLNKTERTDFFINGQVVLRGRWLPFEEDIFVKKIKNTFKNRKGAQKAGHKVAQQKGAKLLGFKKYFKFHHSPYPLRKSTFENYFASNSQVESENIKYKFRNINQFTPQGLANHIEIKNETCVLKRNYQLVYIQSYKKPLLWYKLYFWYCSLNSKKLFMCLQSLDQCAPIKLKFVLGWLQQKINI